MPLPLAPLAAAATIGALTSGDAEAGTPWGVMQRLGGLKKYSEYVDKLFRQAPGAKAFTNRDLATHVIKNTPIQPMTPREFHHLTYALDNKTFGENGQLPKLRSAVLQRRLEELPYIDVEPNDLPPGYAWVFDHDGRHRMQALGEMIGWNTKMPVAIHQRYNMRPMHGSIELMPQFARDELKSRGLSSDVYQNLDTLLDEGLDAGYKLDLDSLIRKY